MSAERIRDELCKLVMVPDPSAGLWFLHDTGLADVFLPELPAMRLEQDPIHRHKDVLSHTIAVVRQVAAASCKVRLAALFHDVGKPKTRSIGAKGVSFHHHEVVGRPHDPGPDAGAAVQQRDGRRRDASSCTCTCGSTPTRWAGPTAAVRRFVRDAGDRCCTSCSR